MAETATVARPYARAAFRHAADHGALAPWSVLLAAGAIGSREVAKADPDGHTLVLGWNHQVRALVSELAVANENQQGLAIVFLVTDDDKPEVDRLLFGREFDLRGTRLVVRSGTRSHEADLRRVAIETARSVVVPRGEDGDPGVVKCLLAVRSAAPDFEGPVVEIGRAHV